MTAPPTEHGRFEHGGLQRQVMTILWARRDCTVRDVYDVIAANRDIAYTTVQTVMNRLVASGKLARERHGNTGVYRPITSTDEAAAGQLVEELVARFGPLALTEFVAHTRSNPALFAALRSLVTSHDANDNE